MKCIKLYIMHILNVSQYSSHQTIFLRENDTYFESVVYWINKVLL